MDGFKRPNTQAKQRRSSSTVTKKSPNTTTTSEQLPALSEERLAPIVIEEPTMPAKKPRRRLWWGVLAFVCILLVAALSGYIWYQFQLQPAGDSSSPQRVVIAKNSSFSTTVTRLKDYGLIKSEIAAKIYGYVSGKHSQLKEGTCILVASESTQAIIDKLTKGCHDFKSITFFPGATIEKPLYKPAHVEMDQTMYVKYVLKAAGYSDEAIATALKKQYNSPLFADKPATASLEGYIYGQTYYVDTNATVEQVLETTFNQMYKDMTTNGLVDKYKKQGLNLFEAVTLASIVQRELNCEGKPTKERLDRCYQFQRTIAQIFLKRLRENTSLGSDVTFIYAADQTGVMPDINIDSPYNTRIHHGLPPGPIAAPGLHALLAVGNPSDTDYLFFIAGDDGLLYFAKDMAGHEANIRNHCQKLCNEL